MEKEIKVKDSDKVKYLFYKIHDESFGYGYGTGESVIIPILKDFVTIAMNNGGQYDFQVMSEAIGNSNTWFLINALCKTDFLEYGTSPRYGWIDHDEDKRLVANFITLTPSDELYEIAMMDYDNYRVWEDYFGN